jgi:hypothetical protein
MDALKIAGALLFFGFGIAPGAGSAQSANSIGCTPPAVLVCFGEETTQVCKCIVYAPAPPPA